MMSDDTENSSVSLLLQTRPQVAILLKDHDTLKRWLIAQFSGKATKFPILWDPDEPEDSEIAEHSLPCGNKPAKIRVSKKMSGRDQLSAVIFELFNIQYCEKQSQLWKQACAGVIGKREYSLRAYRLEYKAMKKCGGFLKRHASVFATMDDSNDLYNLMTSLTSFREFFGDIKKRYGGETYFDRVFEERIVLSRLPKNDANR
jgi:hypothetical protein